MFGLFGRERRLGTREVLARLIKTLDQQETNKRCEACGGYVLAVRPATPRLRNLALTGLTLGVWGGVWIVQSIRRPGWRCSQCGGRVA